MRCVLAALAVLFGVSTLHPAAAWAQPSDLPEARVLPQTQAPVLEGVPQTKVKTLHLDAKGRTAPGPPPGPTAQAVPAPALPPPVKVPLYRVERDGTMHAPQGADTTGGGAGADTAR